MNPTISSKEFVDVLCQFEARGFAEELYAEAMNKGIDPRVLVGVHYRLFSEEEGRALKLGEAITRVNGFFDSKPKPQPRLSKQKRHVSGIQTNRLGLGSQVASALRYMAMQRDSMSD
jgi:hypothetical protein